MKDFRMVDLKWNLTEEDVETLYPELDREQRSEAAEFLYQYLKVIGRSMITWMTKANS